MMGKFRKHTIEEKRKRSKLRKLKKESQKSTVGSENPLMSSKQQSSTNIVRLREESRTTITRVGTEHQEEKQVLKNTVAVEEN